MMFFGVRVRVRVRECRPVTVVPLRWQALAPELGID